MTGAATSRPRQHASAVRLTALLAAALLVGGCTDGGPAPEEQRDVVVRTAQAVVEATSKSMNTDKVAVTDDGTTARECPDGGSRYTYAATIGPETREDSSASPTQALSGMNAEMLGQISLMQADPELEFFPDFEVETWTEPTAPQDARSTTYLAPQGDDKGIRLTFVVGLSTVDQLVVDITAYTRCG